MFAKPGLVAAGIAFTLVAMMPSAADAHRRWLLPSATVFSGDSETVTVDAAASNGLFVFEHRPMPLDNLAVTGPDGEAVEPAIIGTGEYRSVFDVPLQAQGTYRLAIASEGLMGFYELNGERHRWRGTRQEVDQIPAGASDLRISENSSRTETFVTLGAPTTTALEATGSGLEMVPVSHPNDLYAGEPAQMRFLLNGQPAAGLEIEFVQGGTRYRDVAGIQTLTTNAEGVVELTAAEPGMYYLETSQASDAAGAGEYDRRASYTAVLEFLPL